MLLKPLVGLQSLHRKESKPLSLHGRKGFGGGIIRKHINHIPVNLHHIDDELPASSLLSPSDTSSPLKTQEGLLAVPGFWITRSFGNPTNNPFDIHLRLPFTTLISVFGETTSSLIVGEQFYGLSKNS
jgi:hypothetical protein